MNTLLNHDLTLSNTSSQISAPISTVLDTRITLQERTAAISNRTTPGSISKIISCHCLTLDQSSKRIRIAWPLEGKAEQISVNYLQYVHIPYSPRHQRLHMSKTSQHPDRVTQTFHGPSWTAANCDVSLTIRIAEW